MKMARVILFTGRMDAMSKFYGEVLGLKRITNEKGWKDLRRAAQKSRCIKVNRRRDGRALRLSIYAKHVAALRERLVSRGATFGKVREGEFCLCDGKDPDGNPIQLSSR